MGPIISNYWCGIKNENKKFWLNAPKALGGMGFRVVELFNQALSKAMLAVTYCV